MKNDIFTQFDLIELKLLPSNWIQEIATVVEKFSAQTQLDGTSSTSREPTPGQKMDVYVVTGENIKTHLPWLYGLYENDLCQMASKVAGHNVFPSGDLVSSMNINCLRGAGSRYEWHVDSNPMTGLLYVTTHTAGKGGETVFEKDGNRIAVQPESGKFIAFDARKIPHTVLPLREDTVRISVPMNYYDSKDRQDRPSDLDSYLYDPSNQTPIL